jgi:hypothetical protein
VVALALASLGDMKQVEEILIVSHCPRKPRQGQQLLLLFCHKKQQLLSLLGFLGRHETNRKKYICKRSSLEAKRRTHTPAFLRVFLQ